LSACLVSADAFGQLWRESAKLLASDGATDDWFGASVSVSGNVVVVGAIFDDDNGLNVGSAYVFASTNAVPALSKVGYLIVLLLTVAASAILFARARRLQEERMNSLSGS
jgi:hypothetical protein